MRVSFRSEALPGHEAHLWYAWTATCCTPERLAYYRGLLSEDEIRRLERFAFEPLRREFLLARALCRHSLSRYADVAPQDWRFGTNQYGRPYVAMPGEAATLHFNLSHSRSLVACVVARVPQVGVDVEETDRDVEALEIAERFFSAEETAWLRAAPLDARRQRFFKLWTLKESYIKAVGTGLSMSLQSFSVRVDALSPPSLHFAETRLGHSTDWQLALLAPSARHAMAVCLRRAGGADLSLRIRETVPEIPG